MELIDGIQIVKFFAALTFVLALMGGLFLILKRIQTNGPIKMGNARRLRITEVLQLDSRRRAILLRRDGIEHLVILSPNSETVIEAGIISEQEYATDAHNQPANEMLKDAAE